MGKYGVTGTSEEMELLNMQSLQRRKYAYQHGMGQRQPVKWVRTAMYEREYQQENKRRKRRNSAPELEHFSGDEKKKPNGHKKDSSPIPPTKSAIEYFRDITSRMIKGGRASLPFVSDKVPVDPPQRGLKSVLTSSHFKESRLLNVMKFLAAGRHFQCPQYIFEGHSDTLLGNEQRRHKYFNPKNQTFVFPHTLPDVFAAVLDYYETGLLTKPERLTINYFLEQIKLFELEQKAVDKMLRNEGVYMEDSVDTFSSENKSCSSLNWLWCILDQPWTSRTARIYSVVSLSMTILSVLLYVLETLPELEKYSVVGKRNLREAYESPLAIINAVCFIFFTIEFILRFICCPSKKKFFKTWTNWTDLFSILPFIIMHIVMLSGNTDPHNDVSMSIINVVRACRLFLISRVLGTSRYYRQQWIMILTSTLWNNLETLFILFVLLIICMIAFGGLLFADPSEVEFDSIPYGMWWAVITMTTVGYGDIYPSTAFGRVVAIVCGCIGLTFLGFVLESVTFEYHRLMRSNTQYVRYLEEQRKRGKDSDDVIDAKPSDLGRARSSRRNLMEDAPEITVSVNGAQFTFALSDLNRYPSTLLGHPSKRAHYYNPLTGNYFFPRNQDIFPCIHAYYTNTGKPVLKRPPFVSMQRFVEEVEFFQLGPQAIIDLFAAEGIILMEEKQPKGSVKLYWHMVLNHPNFNLLSYCIHIISLLITFLFIFLIVIETIPTVLSRDCGTSMRGPPDMENDTVALNSTSRHPTCERETPFFIINAICTAWFTIEFIARLLCAPSKKDFAKDVMNWFDLMAILPFICTAVQFSRDVAVAMQLHSAITFCRTLRLIRLVGVLRFSRYFRRIQMIFAILRSTWTELLMLCYFMTINSMIFGTLVYMVESGEVVDATAKDGKSFNSIPRGMYWAWITMLTIGYGDFVPATAGGKFVGTACAILGVVFWTMPMTLISDHFASYRRLYESQHYMMRCLTRMYHLRDTEKTRRMGRSSHCLHDHAAEIEKLASADTVLLVDEPDGTPNQKNRAPKSRSPRPPSVDAPVKRRSIAVDCAFPKLYFTDSAVSRD